MEKYKLFNSNYKLLLSLLKISLTIVGFFIISLTLETKFGLDMKLCANLNIDGFFKKES